MSTGAIRGIIERPSQREIEFRLTHQDRERDCWEAARTTFARDWDGGVLKLRKFEGGNYVGTGTVWETIWTNGPNVGTAKSGFTSEFTINDSAGFLTYPFLPTNFFIGGAAAIGKRWRVRGAGMILTTGTPTFQWTHRFGAAASTTVANCGSSATITTGSGLAAPAGMFETELECQITIVGLAGANSSVRGMGVVSGPFAANTGYLLGGGANTGIVATFDWTVINYLSYNSTCGTNSGSNSIQLLDLVLIGQS